MDTDVLQAMMRSVATALALHAGTEEAKRMLEMKTARDRQSYRLVMAGVMRRAIRDGGHPIDAGAMRIVGLTVPDDVPDLSRVQSIELDYPNRLFAVCWEVDDGPNDEVIVSTMLDNDDP